MTSKSKYSYNLPLFCADAVQARITRRQSHVRIMIAWVLSAECREGPHRQYYTAGTSAEWWVVLSADYWAGPPGSPAGQVFHRKWRLCNVWLRSFIAFAKPGSVRIQIGVLLTHLLVVFPAKLISFRDSLSPKAERRWTHFTWWFILFQIGFFSAFLT